MLHEITHCAGRVLADTRPHQLRSGDGETMAAISHRKCLINVWCVHVCVRVCYGVSVRT